MYARLDGSDLDMRAVNRILVTGDGLWTCRPFAYDGVERRSQGVVEDETPAGRIDRMSSPSPPSRSSSYASDSLLAGDTRDLLIPDSLEKLLGIRSAASMLNLGVGDPREFRDIPSQTEAAVPED